MKIFISGKITGDPNYREKFNKVEKRLKEEGYIVLNPAMLPDGFKYEDYMNICFAMLMACEAIYLLKDHMESPGSGREKMMAGVWCKQIIMEDE